jgi:hypothetical protein
VKDETFTLELCNPFCFVCQLVKEFTSLTIEIKRRIVSDQANEHTVEGIDELKNLVEEINTCLL